MFHYTNLGKYNELIRKVEKTGWYLRRHGSKHDIFAHPLRTYILPIPRHGSKEVPKGLEFSILKKAGL